MDTIIKDTLILDMVDERLYRGSIYIKDGKIKNIGDIGEVQAHRVIEGSSYLTMPGFINAHTHVGMSYFRNYGNDKDLMTWLNDYIFPAEEKLNPEIVFNASMLSFSEMIKTGTTCFADMYFYEEATIKALKKARLRAQIARGLSSPDDDEYRIKENIDLHLKYNDQNNGLEIALGPHAVYTTDKEYLSKVAQYAKDYHMPIHIHLSETKVENDQCLAKYSQTPTEVFNECGIFENRTIAAHGVYLSDSDLSILKDKGVSVIHNPSSNLKLSSGILDVKRLIDYGINVCLGTDSAASNNKQSMLREIEMASLLAKLQSPDGLSSFDILKMATINGARALGLSDITGSIEPGKSADILMIDIDNINHTPATDLISSICYSTYDRDISYVFVEGDMLLDRGSLVYLDEEEIKHKARDLYRDLL